MASSSPPPKGWVGESVRPYQNYTAVGLQGHFTSDGRGFVGRITYPDCGAFNLRLR